MFGLEPGRATERPRTEDEAASPALPTIAVVSTGQRDYAVTYVETAPIDGSPAYHLRLAPLRKPNDNRLRELWIGAADYLPKRAVVAGNFTQAPLDRVPWTIDFTTVDGAPFIARETTVAALALEHRRVVTNASITFTDIQTANGSIYDRAIIQPDEIGPTLEEPNELQ
jgi:hypothetical protein